MARKDYSQPRSYGTFITIAAVVGLPVLCCGSCTGIAWLYRGWSGAGQEVAKADKEIKQEAKNLEPEFKLTSEELAKEFVADQLAAKAKYDNGLKAQGATWPGRVLEVTGEVTSVGPTLDQFFLKGAKKNPDDPLEFSIRIGIEPKFQAQCARLSKGQKVKIVGKYFSLMEGAWVTVTECVVTELEPSRIMVLRAEGMAREFDVDSEAATAKYAGKEAIITGLVEDVRKTQGNDSALLKGVGGLRITTNVNSFMQTKVAKDQTLEFRADFTYLNVKNGEIDVLSKMTISVK